MVDRLIKRKPAAVLIAGDFIYHPIEDEPEDVREEFEPSDYREDALEEIRQAVDLIRPLVEAGIPVYAVLGNHDYGMETESAVAVPWLADLVTTSLSEIGIQVLRNQAVLIEPPNAAAAGERSPDLPFYLVGIGAHLARQDDVNLALTEVPAAAARLVLMHHPASFERIPAGQAPLALAAHTHGGQIRLPFLPEWTWLSYVKGEKVHADGWIDGYGKPGNRLYVNRGIGFSKVPIRINCRPELTMFTLRPRS
jgi:predicted MPP superfamily phosphohydrolase